MLTSRILDTETGWRLYDLTLDAGDEFAFPASAAIDCVGSMYVHGLLAPATDEVWPEISDHREWRPRDAWGRWKDNAEAEGAALLKADAILGARWLCIAGKVKVQKVSVSGKHTVPPNVEIVVGWTEEATVVVGDQEGESGEYFEAADAPRTVTGTCDILLVRG